MSWSEEAMPTRDELIRQYASLSDDRLVALAVNEVSGLTAGALEALTATLNARGLGDQLRDAIGIQTRPLAPSELDALVQEARGLPCPSCGSTAVKLNAATVATVRSVMVMTSYEKNVVVGCPACISSAADTADTITAAFGWWGLPFGPVYTLRAISLNAKAAAVSKQEEPTAEFRQFVSAHRGAVALQLQEQSLESQGGPTKS
jgi:hypothetical protein